MKDDDEKIIALLENGYTYGEIAQKVPTLKGQIQEFANVIDFLTLNGANIKIGKEKLAAVLEKTDQYVTEKGNDRYSLQKMKYAIPLFAILLLVIGVFAYFSYSGKKSALSNAPSASSTLSQEAPVTGNPDDVAIAIDKIALDEQKTVSAEDSDTSSISADETDITDVEGSVNENDF